MQFLKNMILIFLDRSKCRAYSDMLSRIPMEFKKMQNKIFMLDINYNLKTFSKSSKPFVLFVSDKSLGGHNLSPLVEIGLTDLPKSGGAMATPVPPIPPGPTPLTLASEPQPLVRRVEPPSR